MVHDAVKIAKPDAAGFVPRGNPERSAGAATQAVYRFLNNDGITLEAKDLLIQLSGRQMKRGVRYTAPALLAGLFVLFRITTVIDDELGSMSITDLQQLARRTIPLLNTKV